MEYEGQHPLVAAGCISLVLKSQQKTSLSINFSYDVLIPTPARKVMYLEPFFALAALMSVPKVLSRSAGGAARPSIPQAADKWKEKKSGHTKKLLTGEWLPQSGF